MDEIQDIFSLAEHAQQVATLVTALLNSYCYRLENDIERHNKIIAFLLRVTEQANFVDQSDNEQEFLPGFDVVRLTDTQGEVN